MASIGIMGGTFNPIHFGHLTIAKAAYEQFHLDEVWFMPNHVPAYKSAQALVSGEKRLTMTKLGIQKYPYFKVSDFELQREGKTYTYETMELLKQQYLEDDFFFIMGADSLYYFDKWVHPERIVKNATILVAARNDRTQEEVQERIEEMNIMFGGIYFHLIKCLEVPCSSSEIRKKIGLLGKEGKLSIDLIEKKDFMLPKEVFAFIIEQHLYV